jgi:hypothetical protein
VHAGVVKKRNFAFRRRQQQFRKLELEYVYVGIAAGVNFRLIIVDVNEPSGHIFLSVRLISYFL